jgi:hypothetical protein
MISELYRNQTADNEDEGWRYAGRSQRKRPPELLTGIMSPGVLFAR